MPIGGDESVPSQSSSVCDRVGQPGRTRQSRASAHPATPQNHPQHDPDDHRRAKPVRGPAVRADQQIEIRRHAGGGKQDDAPEPRSIAVRRAARRSSQSARRQVHAQRVKA